MCELDELLSVVSGMISRALRKGLGRGLSSNEARLLIVLLEDILLIQLSFKLEDDEELDRLESGESDSDAEYDEIVDDIDEDDENPFLFIFDM